MTVCERALCFIKGRIGVAGTPAVLPAARRCAFGIPVLPSQRAARLWTKATRRDVTTTFN